MTRRAKGFGVLTVALTTLLLPATAVAQSAADSRFDGVRLVIDKHGPGLLRHPGFDYAEGSLVPDLAGRTLRFEVRQLQSGTKIRRCTSTAKGAVFGAIAGAAIGSGFAIFVERRLGDVRPGVVATFAAGGAGVGALAGWGYCR